MQIHTFPLNLKVPRLTELTTPLSGVVTIEPTTAVRCFQPNRLFLPSVEFQDAPKQRVIDFRLKGDHVSN